MLRVKGSTATDLTTDPLNVVVSLGLFLMPITLLDCPKTWMSRLSTSNNEIERKMRI